MTYQPYGQLKTHYLINETDIACKTKQGVHTKFKTTKQWARVTCHWCLFKRDKIIPPIKDAESKTKEVRNTNGARKW